MREIKIILLAFFSLISVCANAFPWISPYAYCLGNPVGFIDPDGRDVYMLFYTSGNSRGDNMFRAAAETRKYDIEHSDSFNPSNDVVVLSPVQDLADIAQFVKNVIDTYSESFGATAEFSMWSHAGIDGPTGTMPTSANAIDNYQMSNEGWSAILRMRNHLNSHKHRHLYFHGQTSSAYPSIYTNVRQNTQEMLNGNFSYPTYMVGGGHLGISGRFLPTFSPANPMRSSMNGRGGVGNYFQSGRRF